MIVVNNLGQCSDIHGNYIGNLNYCWQCQSQLVPLPGTFVYYWLNTPTAPQSVSSYIDVTSASDQVSVDASHTRYGYKTSPLNSLYVADMFSESSVYIRNDGKTFLFCHPLGKILLMLNGRLQASFNTSFGQKRIVKMDHVLFFSGNDMSAYQPSLIYLMDSYGVKSCMYQFQRLDNMTTKCFYEKNLKTEQSENNGFASEIRHFEVTNDRFFFQLGDDVILEMTEKDNRIRLEMKDICVSATCDQYGQGHIDIVRYSKENAAVQKVCFNGRKIRVKQNQYSASISAKNELSLGNWSAEHIPNKGEIFNRTVKNELK